MIRILNFLEQSGGMLLTGVTIFLIAGAILCATTRAPVKRQRIGEFTLLFALIWLALACLPMKRIALESQNSAANAPSRADILVGQETPSAADAPSRADVLVGQETPDRAIALVDLENPIPSPTALPPPPPPSHHSLNRPLVYVFLIGSGLMALRILLGQIVLMAIFARSQRSNNFAKLAEHEGLAGVDVRLSVRITRPISFGLLHPKIIIPAGYAENADRIRQVLLHEIAHIQRKDSWGNLLINLAGIALWFHPLYWYLNAQTRLSRELLADDWAATKGDKQSYAMELISIARMRVGSEIASGVALGILGSRSEFFRRMHMLISRKSSLETGCSKVWRAAMMTLGLGILATLAATVGVKPAAAATAAPAAAERKNEPKPDSTLSITPTTRPMEVLNLVDTYENLGLSVLDQELKLMADKHLAMVESVDKNLKEIEANIKIVRNLDPEILKSRGEPGEYELLLLKTGTNIYNVIMNQFKEFPQFKEYREHREKLMLDFQNARKSNNDELAEKIRREYDRISANIPVLVDENIPSVKNMAIQHYENDAMMERQSLKDMESRIQAMQQARERIQSKMTREVSQNGDKSKIEYVPAAKTASLPMDLVSLANSAMEARENVNLAQAKLSKMNKNSPDFDLAITNLENDRQRKELLEGMIQISLKSATEDMATAKAKYDAGVGNSEAFTQFRTQVELLTAILHSMK